MSDRPYRDPAGQHDHSNDAEGGGIRPWTYAKPGASGITERPPYQTTERLTLYVDAANGDDSNDGLSQSSPLATLNAAIAKVPIRIVHKTRIYLNYGDYTNQSGPRLWHRTVSPDSGETFMIVGHDSENPWYDSNKSPSDITFLYGLSSGNRGSEEVAINGIRITGRWQPYHDTIRFNNCVFEGGSGSKGQLVDGYLNDIRFFDCEFKNAGLGVQATQNSRYTLRNCTGSNLNTTDGPGRAYECINGGVVTLRDSDNFVNAGDNPPRVTESGHHIGGPYGADLDGTGNGSVAGDWTAAKINTGTATSGATDDYAEIATTHTALREEAQPTIDVSTTAKTIHNATGSAANVLVLYVVGIDSGDYFADRVTVMYGDSATQEIMAERNTPAARSYSIVNNTDLQLAMGSSTYQVQTKGTMFEL